jgi:transcriptional regulator with XRE-family HTH domain
MTQAQLAAQVGVSRLWVNQVESGHGGAALAKVLQLVSALGMTVNLDVSADARPVVSARATVPMPSVVVERHAPHDDPARAAPAARTQRTSGATRMAMPKARPVGKKGR